MSRDSSRTPPHHEGRQPAPEHLQSRLHRHTHSQLAFDSTRYIVVHLAKQHAVHLDQSESPFAIPQPRGTVSGHSLQKTEYGSCYHSTSLPSPWTIGIRCDRSGHRTVSSFAGPKWCAPAEHEWKVGKLLCHFLRMERLERDRSG
jgi:hypothetical protein